jgi:hypothetical protein
MESFNWIDLWVVSWIRGQFDVEGQGYLAQELAGELGALICMDVFGRAKSREDFMCQVANHGGGGHVPSGEGLRPLGEGVADGQDVFVASRVRLGQWANEIHGEFLERVAGNGGLQGRDREDWRWIDAPSFAANESFDCSGEHAGEPEGAAESIGSCLGPFVGHDCMCLRDDAGLLGFGDDKAVTFGRVVGVRVDQKALLDVKVKEFIGKDATSASAGFEEVFGGWFLGLDKWYELANGWVVHLVP